MLLFNVLKWHRNNTLDKRHVGKEVSTNNIPLETWQYFQVIASCWQIPILKFKQEWIIYLPMLMSAIVLQCTTW